MKQLEQLCVRAAASKEIMRKMWTRCAILPLICHSQPDLLHMKKWDWTLTVTSDLSTNRYQINGSEKGQKFMQTELESKSSPYYGGLPCGCCLLQRRWPFQLPVALQDSDKTGWNVTRCPCGGQNSQAGDTAAVWAHWWSARSHHLIYTFCAMQLQKEDHKWMNGYATMWTISWGYEHWDTAVKTGTIERPEKKSTLMRKNENRHVISRHRGKVWKCFEDFAVKCPLQH